MNLKNIIIMKYGVHAQEDVQNIIIRKKREYNEVGKILWGYNGVLCNPGTQILPFLEENQKKGEETYLLLVRTFSDYNGEGYVGEQFSYDKKVWKEIPKGISVIGSKYAIICDDLIECDFQLNLNNYMIAVGKSFQKPLQEYFRGRVDKACAFYNANADLTSQTFVQVSFYSKVYSAVYIK